MNKLKIGVCSLTIGDEYKNITKLGRESKVKYCNKQEYDFIDDESIYDASRPIPWSKILLLEKYLSDYDYIVWMDGDTMIMNYEKRLEWFIEEQMNDKEFMGVRDGGLFFNTGVWFIKNTDYVKKILRAIYELDESLFDTRYWEQSAFNYIYDNNMLDVQEHCMLLATRDQHYFNCTMYNHHIGDFIIHFLGIRNMGHLNTVMNDLCSFQKEGENNGQYAHRMHWYKSMYVPR